MTGLLLQGHGQLLNAEGLDSAGHRIALGVELLRRIQRLDIGLDLAPLLFHPLLQLLLIAATSGKRAHRDQDSGGQPRDLCQRARAHGFGPFLLAADFCCAISLGSR